MDKIMRSLHTQVLALPDETEVVPGHGPVTTIGEERETNPFLQKWETYFCRSGSRPILPAIELLCDGPVELDLRPNAPSSAPKGR